MAEAALPLEYTDMVELIWQMFPQFSQDLIRETMQRWVERHGPDIQKDVLMNHIVEEMLSMNAIMNDDIIVLDSSREDPRFSDGRNKGASIRSRK